MKLGRGAVVVVELDPTIGYEQRGMRPCVVVSDPDVISDQRFPLVSVVPITGSLAKGSFIRLSLPATAGSRKSLSL